jgi:hypothetical protein
MTSMLQRIDGLNARVPDTGRLRLRQLVEAVHAVNADDFGGRLPGVTAPRGGWTRTSSDRPDRPAIGIKPALSEIEAGSGVRYDERVASACLRLFREQGFVLRDEELPKRSSAPARDAGRSVGWAPGR